jgi:hypothetical protein
VSQSIAHGRTFWSHVVPGRSPDEQTAPEANTASYITAQSPTR